MSERGVTRTHKYRCDALAVVYNRRETLLSVFLPLHKVFCEFDSLIWSNNFYYMIFSSNIMKINDWSSIVSSRITSINIR